MSNSFRCEKKQTFLLNFRPMKCLSAKCMTLYSRNASMILIYFVIPLLIGLLANVCFRLLSKPESREKGQFQAILMNERIDQSFEPPHDKINKVTVRPANTQISLGIRPVWSESSLCSQWVAKHPSFLHAGSEDSDQTGRMPRLTWVFAGRTATLLVLSWGGSF